MVLIFWDSSIFAVTAVDSGSKALEFLGLNDQDDQGTIAEAPSVSLNNQHQVHFWVLYAVCDSVILKLSMSDSIALPPPTGCRCEFDHYRLLHARNDRL